MRAKYAIVLSLLAAFVIGIIAPSRASAQQYRDDGRYYQNQYSYQDQNPDYQYYRRQQERMRREREWREHQRREWREHHRDWDRDRDRDRDWR